MSAKGGEGRTGDKEMFDRKGSRKTIAQWTIGRKKEEEKEEMSNPSATMLKTREDSFLSFRITI